MSRQYLNASRAVDAVVSGQKTFKSYCSSTKIGKTEYALASETLKHKLLLDNLFQSVNISAKKLQVRYGLLLVMTYELLFGKKKIQGGGAVKKALMQHKDNLELQLSELKQSSSNPFQDILNHSINHEGLKYIRVNEIKISISEAIKSLHAMYPDCIIQLDEHIPTLLVVTHIGNKGLGDHPLVVNGSLIIQEKASCFPSQILGDIILANSVYHTNNTDREEGEKKKQSGVSGSNSSDDGEGDDVIDTCAAPGNKTSHLATFLYHKDNLYNNNNTTTTTSTSTLCKHKKGKSHTATNIANSTKNNNHSNDHGTCNVKTSSKLYAFEKDEKRHTLLTQRMHNASADRYVHAIHQDFLTVDPIDKKYNRVKYALIDPSCSGSGLQSIERLLERGSKGTSEETDEKTKQRLHNLHQFQVSVILHAMKLPSIEYIVYSTCSIHNEENEEVVSEVLATINHLNHIDHNNVTSDTGTHCKWELLSPSRFKSWSRRGLPCHGLTDEQLQCVIRCLPEDHTSGFFVALFHKKNFSDKHVHITAVDSSSDNNCMDTSSIVVEEEDTGFDHIDSEELTTTQIIDCNRDHSKIDSHVHVHAHVDRRNNTHISTKRMRDNRSDNTTNTTATTNTATTTTNNNNNIHINDDNDEDDQYNIHKYNHKKQKITYKKAKSAAIIHTSTCTSTWIPYHKLYSIS